jgi:hypothetical protein
VVGLGGVAVGMDGRQMAAEVAQAVAILQAAEAADWAPISHAGQLHDRASYRFFWQLLERAQQTGRHLPSELRQFFDRLYVKEVAA